jgi:hypothetical protein
MCDKRLMHDSFLRALQTQRPQLRRRWEELLRAERVTSGMANPDSLIYLMDWTLEQLMNELRQSHYRRHLTDNGRPSERQRCVCGMNPLLAYFSAAEQAVIEILFLDSGELSQLSSLERSASLEDLKSALHEVARRDIESFCAVCQSRERQAKKNSNKALEVA